MSHSVKITLIADQEIELLGDMVNIHDLTTLILDENGKVIEYYKSNLTSRSSRRVKSQVFHCACGRIHYSAYDGFKCLCGTIFHAA